MSATAPADSREEIAAARRRVTSPASIGLLLLRIGFAAILFIRGLTHATHIDQFTDTVRATNVIAINDALAAWLVVIGELGLPILLLFGFVTRIAAGLVVVLMGLIYYAVHVRGPGALVDLANLPTPINGESALALGIVGLALVFTGPGRFAVDHGLRRGRSAAAVRTAPPDRIAGAEDDELRPSRQPAGTAVGAGALAGGATGSAPRGVDPETTRLHPASPGSTGSDSARGPVARRDEPGDDETVIQPAVGDRSAPERDRAASADDETVIRPAAGDRPAPDSDRPRSGSDRPLPDDPRNWTDEDIQRL